MDNNFNTSQNGSQPSPEEMNNSSVQSENTTYVEQNAANVEQNATYVQQNAGPYQNIPPYNGMPNAGQYNPYPQAPANDPLAIISLVCGILSILFCCCCTPLTIVLGIAAIVLAIISKNNSQDGKFSGIALAGLICGIVGIALSIISIICAFLLYGSYSMDAFRYYKWLEDFYY